LLNNANLVYMNEKYICSHCKQELPRSAFHESNSTDRGRPVTSRCKKCRSLAYKSKIYTTLCGCCRTPSKLEDNGMCHKCNEASGLRYCRECNSFLPLYLYFFGRMAICKTCKKARAAQEDGPVTDSTLGRSAIQSLEE
jgi:hypothetical protein